MEIYVSNYAAARRYRREKRNSSDERIWKNEVPMRSPKGNADCAARKLSFSFAIFFAVSVLRRVKERDLGLFDCEWREVALFETLLRRKRISFIVKYFVILGQGKRPGCLDVSSLELYAEMSITYSASYTDRKK